MVIEAITGVILVLLVAVLFIVVMLTLVGIATRMWHKRKDSYIIKLFTAWFEWCLRYLVNDDL